KVLSILSLPLLTLLLAVPAPRSGLRDLDDDDEGGHVKRKDGRVDQEIARAPAVSATVVTPAVGASGFTPQTRLGFTVGDQWEPAIASDVAGNVYVLYPQYGATPGCPECPNPTMILQISRDGGVTWGTPSIIAPPGSGQWDAQIVVDPADG